MWLLIDDQRNLSTEAVARTAAAGKVLLKAHDWECVCFDHDLGEATSGYDVLVWALNEGIRPPRIVLVTSNPVGRNNMAAALVDAGYHSIDNVRFHRDS